MPTTADAATAGAEPLVATLPMYDFPAVRPHTEALYEAVAAAYNRLRPAPLPPAPAHLAASTEAHRAAWENPARLFLSQTCGLPLVTTHAAHLEYVGTPAYTPTPCQALPGHNTSLLVASATASATLLEELAASPAPAPVAINSIDSLSGHVLLAAMLPTGLRAPGRTQLLETGGHQQSLAHVRDGRAALAAIDAVTFALLARHSPEAVAGVRVLGRGPSAPALPFVCGRGAPVDMASLQAALAEGLSATTPQLARAREALLLQPRLEMLSTAVYRQRVAELQLMGLEAVSDRDGDGDGDGEDSAPDPSASIWAERNAARSNAAAENDMRAATAMVAMVRLHLHDQQRDSESKFAHGMGREREGVPLPELQSGLFWEHRLEDGRDARLYFPHGRQPLLEAVQSGCASGRRFACVVFFGERPAATFPGAATPASREVEAEVWALDEAIMRHLPSTPAVLAYCSIEQPGSSNWMNLVVVRGGPEAITAWLHVRNPAHTAAAGAAARRYYWRVRIYRALLAPAALLPEEAADDEAGELCLEPCRTLWVEYALPERVDDPWDPHACHRAISSYRSMHERECIL